MQKENPLDIIVSYICEGKLYSGIQEMENYFLTNPKMPGMDKLATIKDDYNLMAEYWKRGIEDSEREQVYRLLLHRLYVLTMNIYISKRYRFGYWTPQGRTEWGVTGVRNELESFVSDAAVLDLEPEHVRKVKLERLHMKHQMYMRDLFNVVLTSQMWSEGIAEQYVDILLSPTVDVIDQQLLVSAITLSVLNAFDVNKVLTLVNVYRQSANIRVRQRALVGWVLAMDEEKSKLYPEMQRTIAEVCADESVCQELTELQMQLFYCKEAESDQKKIRDEIMPDIMSGSRIKMTQKGLVEMDEDTLEDILHPDAAEREMEKMEQSVQRMAEMQKQGSDIYFAGFSHMKRFPFFNDLSNWLVPFYANHPAISKIWNDTKGKKFLHSITKVGAFCDGDKYSFVLAFEEVLNHLPAQMIKMVEDGEASPLPIGGAVDDKEKHNPAYIRRMYLQDLYRIFRLYPMRNELHNPFEHQENYLFFANSLFAAALKPKLFEIVAFLIKRQRIDDAYSVLTKYPEKEIDYQYCMLNGHIMQFKKQRNWILEKGWFEFALKNKPGDRKAMVGLARALYGMKSYDKALDVYQQLLEGNPESKSYMLNAAICMVNLRKCGEALKLLFKLNYLYPEDMTVVHVLAWALTLADRQEEALKYYDQLAAQEQPFADHFLYNGYCLWFMGRIAEAVLAFRRYLGLVDNDSEKLEKAFMETEYDILRQHQISESEIQMMLDAVSA